MKKVIAAIFAHPDDEAFGPAGTIAKVAKNNDVYILTATKGEAGQNYSDKNKEPLWKIREKELLASAKILGVKKVFFLGFTDGDLSNNLYHKLTAKIEEVLKKIKADTIITDENRGISGHLDHIAVSLASTFVFEKMHPIKQIYYFFITDRQRNLLPKYLPGGYFVYFPPGYKESKADMVSDISDVWEIKMKAMTCHQSQLKDVKRVQGILSELPKKEFFFVRKK